MQLSFDPTNPEQRAYVLALLTDGAAAEGTGKKAVGRPPKDKTAPAGTINGAAPVTVETMPGTSAAPPVTTIDTPKGVKPPAIEDVRACMQALYDIVGKDAGKETVKAVLAKAGAKNLTVLEVQNYAQVIGALNTWIAKAKADAATGSAPTTVEDDPMA